MYEMWKKGNVQLRSLEYSAGAHLDRKPDGRPSAFTYPSKETLQEAAKLEARGLIDDTETVIFTKQKHSTLVYTAEKELFGATLQRSDDLTGSCKFEIFFIPSLPSTCVVPVPPPPRLQEDLIDDWSRRWNRDFHAWNQQYIQWYPQSPKNRSFQCCTEHPVSRLLSPLPTFVTTIALPKRLLAVGELLAWIKTLTFTVPSSFFHTGELNTWLPPSMLLKMKKGTVNDHAVLLCSCLLGAGYDAYVCKGTIDKGEKQHSWVMTRHSDGYVVFWEPTQRRLFHLPNRWKLSKESQIPTRKGQDFNFDSNPYEIQNSYYDGSYLESWYDYIRDSLRSDHTQIHNEFNLDSWIENMTPDEKTELSDIANLWLHGKYSTGAATQTDDVMNFMSDNIRLPILPSRELTDPEDGLGYVPYSSIEILFNNLNLWGNLQNHHPALIYYDLTYSTHWRQFLFENPLPIDSNVVLQPPLKEYICATLANDLKSDLCDTIRLRRNIIGLETSFDNNNEAIQKIEKFLDLMEFKLHLDGGCDPGVPYNHSAWSSWESIELEQQEIRPSNFDHGEAAQHVGVQNVGVHKAQPSVPNDEELRQTSFHVEESTHGAPPAGPTPATAPTSPELKEEKKPKDKRRSIRYRGVPLFDVGGTLTREDGTTVDQLLGSVGGSYQTQEEYKGYGEDEAGGYWGDDMQEWDTNDYRGPESVVLVPQGREQFTEGEKEEDFESEEARRREQALLDEKYEAARLAFGERLHRKGMDLRVIGLEEIRHGRNVIKGATRDSGADAGTKHKIVDEKMKKIPPAIWQRRMYDLEDDYDDEVSKWKFYYRMEQIFYNWHRQNFPCPPNHTFIGFPVQLSTCEPSQVHSFLVESGRFKHLLELPLSSVVFFVHCKVYAHINDTYTSWFFIGCQVPWKSQSGNQQLQTL
eukprot:GHVP01015604.1.p1 GENE.GHVP01015604.1~~GHVP01015604.1.p1  ORF type:complete len:918 (+),score=178.95 GHVP01015604.1:382-3135(+)